jgi:uncharacterized protein
MFACLLTRHFFSPPALRAWRILAALVTLTSIAVVNPALAQVPARSPSPAAILIAKQILEIKGTKQTVFDPLVRGVIEKAKDQFMQTNFMWAKDLNEVAAQLEKQYAPRSGELLDAAARIYASHFTEAELRQLLAWYRSPLGRKALVEEPKAFDEGLAHAGEWGENFSTEVIARMRDEMKKRGHDL